MNTELELLDFLKGLGFEGSQLASDIGQLYREHPAMGTITAIRKYGEEQMRFDLRFEHDRQFHSYRLAGYLATHRDPIVIEHKTINGIDTAILEQRMKQENWTEYFGNPDEYRNEVARAYIAETIASLDKLCAHHNFDGRQIQEELRFKYWPFESYNDGNKEDLRNLYETSRTFVASPYGICKTDLAYHIVSGHLDRLHEQLMSAGLEQYPGIDLHSFLESQLSNNPESFKIECSKEAPEGIIDYSIPVHRTEDGYEAGQNLVTFTAYPEFVHGIYNGVDSADLEMKMKTIQWDKDETYYLSEDDVIFLPYVVDINNQISKLAEDEKGLPIAEYLLLRYWAGHPVFEACLQPETWEAFKSWPTIKQEFPLTFEARSIYNLMCGRPIIAQPLGGYTFQPNDWLRLDPVVVSDKGIHPFELIPGPSRDEVEQQIRTLPLENVNVQLAINNLLKGDRIDLSLKGNQEVRLEVVPEEKSLQLYTTDMQPIAFNFRVDPDWKRPEMPGKVIYQAPTINKQNRRHTKGRRP